MADLNNYFHMNCKERGDPACVCTAGPAPARVCGWLAALIIALVVPCVSQTAKAQSLLYAYTGNTFDVIACTAHFGSGPPTCTAGSITARVTFNNMPAGFTGVVGAASGSGGTSFCTSATVAPCVGSFTAVATGVNIARTVIDPTGVAGSNLLFTFSGGNITSWLLTIQDVSTGNNLIGIDNAVGYIGDSAETSPSGTAGLSTTAGTWALVAAPPAAFFGGENSLGSGVYYLQFPNGNLFGYFNLANFPILYHYDMGFEAFVDGGNGAAYLYDFSSSRWFYTSPSLFPYLYDFTLDSWIYYFPDTKNPGHYTTNPRYFSNLTTGKIFMM